MSGHAASLAQPSGPRQFGESIRLLSQRVGRSLEKVQGDLRLPLDFTYHGCPWIIPHVISFRRGSRSDPTVAIGNLRCSRAWHTVQRF